MKKKTKRNPILWHAPSEFLHFIAAHFADFGRSIGHDEYSDGRDVLLEGEFQDLVLEELERITFMVKI